MNDTFKKKNVKNEKQITNITNSQIHNHACLKNRALITYISLYHVHSVGPHCFHILCNVDSSGPFPCLIEGVQGNICTSAAYSSTKMSKQWSQKKSDVHRIKYAYKYGFNFLLLFERSTVFH